MRKWIAIGFLILFLLLMILGVNLIENVVDSGNDIDPLFISNAINETPLDTFSLAKHYYGTDHLIIVFGKDEKGQEMIVWMREDGKTVHYDWQKYGITEDEVMKRTEQNYDVHERIDITPGMENGIYLWEAVYREKGGSYLYVYFNYDTGDFLRSIKLKTLNHNIQ